MIRQLPTVEVMHDFSLFDIARFRQGAYRLLSSWFLYPDEWIVSLVPDSVGILREYEGEICHLAFSHSWSHFLDELEKLGTADLVALQTNYMDLFGGSGRYQAIPLCETAYTKGSSVDWLLRDILDDYRRQGMLPGIEEAPDHIALELEFLSFLCRREQRAWLEQTCDTAVEFLQCQNSFLTEHLALWLPVLVERVAARRNGYGFYQCLVRTCYDLVVHDSDFTGALPGFIKSAKE